MISVIIATYNGEKFIREQLDSILHQTKIPDEILIIDDYSTDSTREILKSYKKENTNVEVIFNDKNIGHYKTFLKGIEECRGDYIFFSDQDDIWDKNKIQKVHTILKEENAVFVRTNSEYINSNNQKLNNKKVSGEKVILNVKENFNFWGSGYEMAITKKIKKVIVESDPNLISLFEYHDVLVGMLSPLVGKSILLDEVLNYHRLHENNVTQKISSKSFNYTKEDKVNLIAKYIIRLKTIKLLLESNKKMFDEKNFITNIIIIEKYIKFNILRKKFLKNRNLVDLIKIVRSFNLYVLKKDFVSDFIYGYDINKIINYIKRIKKC